MIVIVTNNLFLPKFITENTTIRTGNDSASVVIMLLSTLHADKNALEVVRNILDICSL